MAEHLFKNWPVYVLLIGFIWFLTGVIIHANKEERKKIEQENSKKV
jgi:hypothetical protein